MFGIESLYMFCCESTSISIRIVLLFDVFSDMEPARQAVYFGMSSSAVVGEGLYLVDCTPSPAPCPGPAGEERREGQIRRQDQPWSPRALVRGPQQTPRSQSWCPGVSGSLPPSSSRSIWNSPSTRRPLSPLTCIISLSLQVCCEILQRCSASVSEALLHQWRVLICPLWTQEDEAERSYGRYLALPPEWLCQVSSALGLECLCVSASDQRHHGSRVCVYFLSSSHFDIDW